MTLLNILLIGLLVLAVIVVFFLKLTDQKNQPNQQELLMKKYSIAEMTEYVKNLLHELTNDNISDLGLSEEEFKRRKSQRSELKNALKGCSSGDINDKIFVKEFIFDLLYKTYDLTDQNIDYVIPFSNSNALTAQDKFEILLHLYKKNNSYEALTLLITTHGLDMPRKNLEGDAESFFITKEEIEEIYRKEVKALRFQDKLQIVVQRIYQNFKGFSVIDEIRDMNIDGVSGGVSGLPPSINSQLHMDDAYSSHNMRPVPRSHDSVWIFFRGNQIHLSFLSFGDEAELRRVCQNIYKYNNPGQLSEANGYIVNEMKDNSRVVVVRPPFAESWAFFVRKFDTKKIALEKLITANNDTADIAIQFIKHLMKGCRITAITGHQGTGKTTLMMAAIKYIWAGFTLRVQEMTFELHLRKIYPFRNILSFRETDHITGQEGLDIQKKTDGAVNILGEVATDPVAAWMIQMGQVASVFTIFSHHAKTTEDLVFSLRNSLLKIGMFNNEVIAEQQVISVLNFDIHLKKGYDGTRYIERVTEIIPIKQDDYPQKYKQGTTITEKIDAFMDTATEYFRRMTDRKTFITRNVIEYRNGQYHAVNPISDQNRLDMLEHMSLEEQNDFTSYLKKYWGD